MAGYKPLKISANATGLVQSREEFLLPDDAYPTLMNAYVWRERILRKQGWEKLARLSRVFNKVLLTPLSANPTFSFNIYTDLSTPITKETYAEIMNKSVTVWINPTTTTGPVQGYTIAHDCEVTSAAHGLTSGTIVTISGVVVVPGSGPDEINGGPYTIEVIDVNHFKLAVPSNTWGSWQSGGTWSTITGFANQLIDQGDGTLATNPVSGVTGTINYLTGAVVITNGAAGDPTAVSFTYFPGLPVMGIIEREIQAINIRETVWFDTVYAYRFEGDGFVEFQPGTTWTGSDSDFFWGANYWVDKDNNKIFWVTNDTTDPIRYTNGLTTTNWIDFSPNLQSVAPTVLNSCKIMLPFRGRMVIFNTVESNISFPNRIRWAAIGNPFSIASAIVTTVNAKAWYDDIRGQGGFLDIPTTEDIITVGFVRDNLVIYCEHSTWQLRYTGRSIAPFQVEKVNSELGVQSTFSGVQFDTSLVGIGDKGITECDSYESRRIDVKIPDLVLTQIQNQNNGPKRIQGIRDFEKKLAYWIYPSRQAAGTYPDLRLCYNYENDSWAIFTDSLTALGTFQPQTGRTWLSDPNLDWNSATFPWSTLQTEFPAIMGGNQQGYTMYLNEIETNDPSLFIYAITGQSLTSTATLITSPNHNLSGGAIIKIVNISATSPFAATLNNNIFSAVVIDVNTFQLWKYNSTEDAFNIPQIDPVGAYLGGGEVMVRDNFQIVSKRFNYNDEGQKYQLGYIDILTQVTPQGAITLNVYNDYQDPISGQASNQYPLNEFQDQFFNMTVPTSNQTFGIAGGQKNWQRVFCPTNANFITIEWTLSNLQLIGPEQESDVQIDQQVIWSRPGGRLGITS